MMGNVKIISDGTSEGTKVQVDGKTLEYVSCIEIDPIEPNSFVTAKVTIGAVHLDMVVKESK